MDLLQLSREAIGQGKYLNITYNGISRDVYPVSFRDRRLFAWCSLHPLNPIESFVITEIIDARVSANDAIFVPSLDVEIEAAASEE